MRGWSVGVVTSLVVGLGCGGKAAPPPTPPLPPPPPAAPVVANVAPDAPEVTPVEDFAPGDPPVDEADAPTTPTGPPLLKWPVKPFTKAQRAEVNACKFDQQPASGPKGGPPTVKSGMTTCQLAVWAAACVSDPDAVAGTCDTAYLAVVKANPAFALAGELIGPYWGKATLVAPPITAPQVIGVTVNYEWSGLGDKVSWTAVAKFDAKTIAVTGSSAPKTPTWTAKVDAVRARFEGGLTSFLPIPGPISAIACTDNYPSWAMTIELADHRKLALMTNGSALIGLGGPWQMTEGGVTYLQVGPGIVEATIALVKALDLPIGEPRGQYCHGFDLQAAVLPP